jgi:hypothetical protein
MNNENTFSESEINANQEQAEQNASDCCSCEECQELGPCFEGDFVIAVRSDDEIMEAFKEAFDKVWYNRSFYGRCLVEEGGVLMVPQLKCMTRRGGARMREKYGEEELMPLSDSAYAYLCGELSALRWAMGDEWDNLNT